jgi:hypothetical protein
MTFEIAHVKAVAGWKNKSVPAWQGRFVRPNVPWQWRSTSSICRRRTFDIALHRLEALKAEVLTGTLVKAALHGELRAEQRQPT